LIKTGIKILKRKNMDLTQLQAFFDKNLIPSVPERIKTFLEIARQPHYENVISNIYSFFFDINEDHGLEDLFIKSFIQLIKNDPKASRKKLEDLEDFYIDTEYATSKGRIDLLLSNDTHAIIVENKIYHQLNNDLDEYWNYILNDSDNSQQRNDVNCIGVVLSLFPLEVSPSEFINITHRQFLTAVFDNCGPYLMNANQTYITFIKDFYQNILNLSTKVMKEEDLEFYVKNKEEITELEEFNRRIKSFVVNEVEKAVHGIDGVKLLQKRSTNHHYYRFRQFDSIDNSGLMYTIVFGPLINFYSGYFNVEDTLSILVEFKHEVKEKKDELDQQIDMSSYEDDSLFNREVNSDHVHFYRRSYKLEIQEFAKLKEFIIEKIQKDGFQEIFEKLNAFLNQQKDSGSLNIESK